MGAQAERDSPERPAERQELDRPHSGTLGLRHNALTIRKLRLARRGVRVAEGARLESV